MVFRWLTIGVAIGAALYAYQNPTAIPLSSSEASLRLREFWHRTFLFHQGSPYEGGLFEQSHIKQHPPPKDALSPAVAKKQAEEAAVREAKLARAKQAVPSYFISHGSPPNIVQPESLQYGAWQSVGKEILDLKPKAIVVASPYWLGEGDGVQVNTGAVNDIIRGC
jgi:hypothetical protein